MNENPTRKLDTEEVLPDREVDELLTREEITKRLSSAAGDGTLALAGGGLVLARALRGLRRRPVRSMLQLLVGAAVLRIGLQQRRATSGASTDEGVSEHGQKDTSDDAHAAAHRHDLGRETETGPEGDVGDEPAVGTDGNEDATFTDEGTEPRTDSGVDGDPRLESDADETEDESDDGTKIDVSSTALADEPGEAAGPVDEQAQPTQTDATEPEMEPDDDVSLVDPDGENDESDGGTEDEGESSADSGDTSTEDAEDDETETGEIPDDEGMRQDETDADAP